MFITVDSSKNSSSSGRGLSERGSPKRDPSDGVCSKGNRLAIILHIKTFKKANIYHGHISSVQDWVCNVQMMIDVEALPRLSRVWCIWLGLNKHKQVEAPPLFPKTILIVKRYAIVYWVCFYLHSNIVSRWGFLYPDKVSAVLDRKWLRCAKTGQSPTAFRGFFRISIIAKIEPVEPLTWTAINPSKCRRLSSLLRWPLVRLISLTRTRCVVKIFQFWGYFNF